MSGFEGILRSEKLYDIIQELVARKGIQTLADEIGVDKSALSRFKNGEGALVLRDVEKILEIAGVTIMPAVRYRRLISNLISMSELLKGALGW